MKVIDLLNKIANGEEVPEEIMYSGDTYHAEFNPSSGKYYYCDDEDNLLLERIDNVIQLGEIIEEDKKIEKLHTTSDYTGVILSITDIETRNKINEIIDYLEEKE